MSRAAEPLPARHPRGLEVEDSCLVVVDVQPSLMKVIPPDAAESVLRTHRLLLEAARVLEVPVLATEQYPKGLGETVAEVRDRILGEIPSKTCFSSLRLPAFRARLEELQRGTVVVTGLETHVCVYQTVLDLVAAGYRVHVPRDAVASRKQLDWATGLELARDAGAVVTCTEAVVFQWLREAGTPSFKEIAPLLK